MQHAVSAGHQRPVISEAACERARTRERPPPVQAGLARLTYRTGTAIAQRVRRAARCSARNSETAHHAAATRVARDGSSERRGDVLTIWQA